MVSFFKVFLEASLMLSMASLSESLISPHTISSATRTATNSLQGNTIVNSGASGVNLLQMTISLASASASTSSLPIINNWIVEESGSIIGNVYGSPKSEEGEEITTSTITNVEPFTVQQGDVITTFSGSKYLLGTPQNQQQQRKQKFARSISSLFSSIDMPSPSNMNIFNNDEKDTSLSSTSTFQPSPPPLSSTSQPQIEEKSKISSKRGTSPFDSLPKRTKRPKPFASIPFNTNNRKNEDTKIPVLDNWMIDSRTEEINGIISNSPVLAEEDGDVVTTDVIATNLAFVVEGFTILTIDGRKYKLGTPKKQSKGVVETIRKPLLDGLVGANNDDEVKPWNTPTLEYWDIDISLEGDGGVCLVGIIQGTNDPNVPNGQLITTDEVITSEEFLDDGFSIVTATGLTYKLGKRDTVGKRRRRVAEGGVIFGLPTTTSTKTSSNPFNEDEFVDETQSAATMAVATLENPFSFISNENDDNPTLEKWSVNELGQVTGIVNDSTDDECDGQVLTTNPNKIPSLLYRPGFTVYGNNGVAYQLGTKGSSDDIANMKKDALARRSSIMNRKNVGIALIDNWSFTDDGGMTGIVSSSQNPDIQDGYTVTTSKIVSVDVREGQVIETINGSLYILGSKKKEKSMTIPELDTEQALIGIGIGTIIGVLIIIVSNGLF